VTAENYHAALGAAIKEYEALGEQRREIDQRLSRLAQSIGALSRLVGLVPSVPIGITDGCRLVLRGGLPMTPVDVRDRLLEIGMDLSVYASSMSAVHTVLKRLNEAGEIPLVPRPNGTHAYLWRVPPTAVAIGPEIAQFIRGRRRRRAGTTPHSRRKGKKK